MGLIDKIKDFLKEPREQQSTIHKSEYGCSVCGEPIDEEYGSECSKECFDEAMMRSYHY